MRERVRRERASIITSRVTTVHSGDDGRRGPTRWRRKTRRGDSNWQSGRRNEWGCSADIGGRREERRWRYVWRNWSRREEGGDLSWSRLGI